MGAEQHLVRAFRHMDRLQPDHIVVDAISACTRMGTEKAAFDYLMRLVDRCKCHGITSLMTNQLDGLQADADFSGIGFSSLLDTIVFLRYVDLRREVARSLRVLKSRGSKHSNHYHPYAITDEGIQIKPKAAMPERSVGRDERPPWGARRTRGTGSPRE
jgi:circadian clock protein KaiC